MQKERIVMSFDESHLQNKDWRKAGAEAARNLAVALQKQKQWARETFLSEYQSLCNKTLVEKWYQRIVVYWCCIGSSTTRKYQTESDDTNPPTQQKKEILLRLEGYPASLKVFSEILNDLHKKAIQEGIQRTKQMCLITAPHPEEFQLMREVLVRRFKNIQGIT